MVHTYATTAIENSFQEALPCPPLAFRNQCGRRGCAHIFEYDGPNPLENIQRLVREHSPSCRGQRPDLVMNIFWGLGNARQDDEECGRARQDYMPVGASRSPSLLGSDRDDGGSKASVSSIDGMDGVRFVSPSGKKSSRAESQRRHALESDEWTVLVFPHKVVCRGCRRIIKLDRRNRYYPGLWEKHRERCKGVGKMKETLGLQEPGEQAWIPPAAFPIAGLSSSRASSFRSSEPEGLAPRKSYYRNPRYCEAPPTLCSS
ncbi:hypothetical protein C8R47DRAFT_1201070 [Mycena vitilis]|nr:hypothetical protein C8R47DRAFT_1201070 [Mycena vitilis]